MNLLETYLNGFSPAYTVFDKSSALAIYKQRDPLAHKGNFGHALILAGSYGKIGAAILSSRACISAGAGLTTSYLPACGYEIMQATVPESMVLIDDDQFHLTGYPSNLEIFEAAGIGPGIGLNDDTSLMLKSFLKTFKKPLVLDADALNIISRRPKFLSYLHPDTIITPHPREFDRLFGPSDTDKSRFEKAVKAAVQFHIIIILKGHFTGIFYPDGRVSFNTNGNAGMAKGGSGDVLTGIITGLLAQSYTPVTASSLGVFLHGYAGDLAAASYSEESMSPSDLIRCLGKTFLELKSAQQS
jgi:ADP-dependent NAD(P)H-hydrate dehydratase / NAD(P)H-hydrate epimerase